MSIKRIAKSLILCSSFCLMANHALAKEIFGYSKTPEESQKRIEILTPKAEKGDPKAQYELVLMYKNEKGVRQNYKKAMSLLRETADYQHKKAQFFIGSMYENGEGVKKDLNEACGWYTLSCGNRYILGCKAKSKLEKKGIQATFNFLNEDEFSVNQSGKVTLGLMYKNGKGVRQNYKKAMSLLHEAAPMQPDAQFIIGSMYENGEGVKKDLNEACGWYTLSCRNEYTLGCKAKSKLEKKGIQASQEFLKNSGPLP